MILVHIFWTIAVILAFRTGIQSEREALLPVIDNLTSALRSKIDGLPDNPWVPGANFADGELMSALVEAEETSTKFH